MIRKATKDDILRVAELYNILLDYEEKHVKYTSWQKGIYPTADTAKLGVKNDSLYVCEIDGKLLGTVILDTKQPPEYRKIKWQVRANHSEALVIHTLCVHPEYSGSGIGSAIVDFAKCLAKEKNCLAIRLNTTERNVHAAHLYLKNGFLITAVEKILLNGQIPCDKHIFMEYKI